ncbi:Metallo-dependent phosphatase-like protein [Scheffersomyces coipomensis]|uniref:Metallo-dependent phosphatase-like protein n=1 Tax=Scheffersomyces coipomensis TaxID=1788519 RepID=UPI00315C5B76
MAPQREVSDSQQIKNALDALNEQPANNNRRYDVYITESGEEKSTKERYMKDVEYPVDYIPTEEQVFLPNGLPNCDFIKNHFIRQGRLDIKHATKIIKAAGKILSQEPNLLHIPAPVTVCGDIHGQYYDLMKLFEVGGDPATTRYLFLGDYVDRGFFSCECLLYLYALKITYPDTLFMIRGNHECEHLTEHFTYKSECVHKYSLDFYQDSLASFNTLPLAAIMNQQFFCVHGGLSPDLKTLKDIERIDRFQEPPHSGLFCDLIWSDPIEEYDDDSSNHHFVKNVVRGCSYSYTYKASCQFLERNNLLCIIRAHEAQSTGYRMYKRTKKVMFPSVLTLFSAPNYCDNYHNKAAVLKYDGKVMNIRQFENSPHPYYLPDFKDVFTWSLPFVGQKVVDMLLAILNICTEEELEEEDTPLAASSSILKRFTPGIENSNSIDQEMASPGGVAEEQEMTLEEKRKQLRNKIIAIGKMSRMFQVLRDESENVKTLKNLNSGVLPRGSLLHGSEGLQRTLTSFEDVKKADAINEAMPPSAEETRQRELKRSESVREEIEHGQSNPVVQKLIRRLSQNSINNR